MCMCEGFEVSLKVGAVIVNLAIPCNEGYGAVCRDNFRAVKRRYASAVLFQGVVVCVGESFGGCKILGLTRACDVWWKARTGAGGDVEAQFRLFFWCELRVRHGVNEPCA